MNLPLTYQVQGGRISDASRKWVESEVQRYYTHDPIRAADLGSLRAWMEDRKHLLTGRVLDYGCGKPGTCRIPQPYRDLCTGEYVGYDKGDVLPPGYFDAVICTQVIQYLPCPRQTVGLLWQYLHCGGHLLLTGPSSWAEVEDSDFWRYTRSGIRKVVEDAGFEVLECVERAGVQVGAFRFSLGWGLVGRRNE